MEKKRILITGGSGFVGGHLIHLAKRKFEVHATFFNHPVTMPGVNFHRIDMAQSASAEKLFAAVNPDVIIHTAAISNPDFCEKNKYLARTINFAFSAQLFDFARKNQRRFIFTSSDLVFDGTRKNYTENSLTNPLNFYARTKVDAENYILKYSANAVIARLALVYGLGITRKNTFFETTIKKMQSGEQVVLFDDQFRASIWVNDLAVTLLELAANDFRGIIHLGGGECLSRWEFGNLMCEIFGFEKTLIIRKSMEEVRTTAPRPKKICLDNTLARQVLRSKIRKPSEALPIIRKSVN
ncbi:MAG: SDR family oxidoreductase [Calditrichaeota bacterium]|nr:SDR family oxidoreductase [Calditrichota bacterium]